VITAVTLSPADASRARIAALARMGQNLAIGRPPAYGADALDLGIEIDGARAEVAFARMIGADLDRQWSAYTSGSLTAIGSDVAGWQVRSTRWPNGHLIIHPRDHLDARFALVLTNGVRYLAVGWITAREARRPVWWRQLNHGQAAAWCVPQDQLHPFDDATGAERADSATASRKAPARPGRAS
jgi:hypothetical protein